MVSLGPNELTCWPPWRCGSNFTSIFFKLVLWIDTWGDGLKLIPQNPIDDKSTLVQIMSWCQATSHYLGQCWPRSMSPYGIIRPQWVKHTYTLPSWLSFYMYVMSVLEKKKPSCVYNQPHCFLNGYNVTYKYFSEKFSFELHYHNKVLNPLLRASYEVSLEMFPNLSYVLPLFLCCMWYDVLSTVLQWVSHLQQCYQSQ